MESLVIIILMSAALLAVFIVAVWYFAKRTGALGEAILLNVAFLVPIMSHVWHLILGEELLAEKCSIDDEELLAWTACMEGLDLYTWAFDSYEVTVTTETIILYLMSIILIYVSPALKKTTSAKALITVFSSIGICSAVCLAVLPYKYMTWYVPLFNVINTTFGLVSFFIVHENLQPFQNKFNKVPTATDDDNIELQELVEQQLHL